MGNILTNYQGKECEDVHYIVSGSDSHDKCLLKNRELEHTDEVFDEYSDSAIEPLQSQANISVTHTTEFPLFSNTCITEYLSTDTLSQKHMRFDTISQKMEYPIYFFNRSITHSTEERKQTIPTDIDTYVFESIRDKIILCGEMEHMSEKWTDQSHEMVKYCNFYISHESVLCWNHKSENVSLQQKEKNWNQFKDTENYQQNGKTNIMHRDNNLLVKYDDLKHAGQATFQREKKMKNINIIKYYFSDDVESQFTKLIGFLLLESVINFKSEQKRGNCNLKRNVVNLISEMYRIQNFKLITSIFLIYLISKDSKTMNYICNAHKCDRNVCKFLKQGFLGKLIALFSSYPMSSFIESTNFVTKSENANDNAKNTWNSNNDDDNGNTPQQLITCDKVNKLQRSRLKFLNILKNNGTCFQNLFATSLNYILNEGMEVILHFKNFIKDIEHNSYLPYCVRVLSEDLGGFSDIKDSAVCLYENTKEELNLKEFEKEYPGILDFVGSSWGKAVYNSNGKQLLVLFYKENTYINDTKVPDDISLDSVLCVGMPVMLSSTPDSLNVVVKLFWYIGYITELNDCTGSVLFYDNNIQERESILSHEVYIDKMKCETSKLKQFLFVGMNILLTVQPLKRNSTKYRVSHILRNGGKDYPMFPIINLKKTFSVPLDFVCQKAQGQVSLEQSHVPNYSEIISSLKTALVAGGLMWRECLQNKCFANIGNCTERARFSDSPGIVLSKGILRVLAWGKSIDVLFNTNDVYINGERCLNPEIGDEFHCTASILPSPGLRGETHFAWCIWQGLRPEVQHVFNSFSGLCPEELLLEEKTIYKGLVVAVYPPFAALATISAGKMSVPVIIYVNILTEKKTKQGFPTGPWIIDYINVGDYLNVTVRRAQKSNKSLNKLGFKWIAVSASKIDLRGITHKTVLRSLYEGSMEESKTITGTILAVYLSFGLITYTLEDKVEIGIFIKNQLLIDGRKYIPAEQLKNTLKNGSSVSFTAKLTNFINKEIHLISFSIKSVKNYEICAKNNLKCICQLKNNIAAMNNTSLIKYCGKIADIIDDTAILSCDEKRILFYKNSLSISGFKREKISNLSEVIQTGMVFYSNSIPLDNKFVHTMNATHYSYHIWDGVLPHIEYTFDTYFTSQTTDVPPINTELCGVVSDIVSPHLGMVIVQYNSYNVPVLFHITNFSLEKGGKKLTVDQWIQEYISVGDTVSLMIKNCKRFRFLTAKEFWKSAIISNNKDKVSNEGYDQSYNGFIKDGLTVKKFQEISDSNNGDLQQKEQTLLNYDTWKMGENNNNIPSRFRSIEGVVSERNVAVVCTGKTSFNVYYTNDVIFINGKRGSEISVGDSVHCTATKQYIPEMKKDAYVASCIWQGMRPDVDKVFESFYNDSLNAIVLAESEKFTGTVSAIYPPDAAIVNISLGCLHIPIILYVQALKYTKSNENWINDFISIGDRLYLYVKSSSCARNHLGFRWVALSASKIDDREVNKIDDQKKLPLQNYNGIIKALYQPFGLISFQIRNEEKVAMFFKENVLINGENIISTIALKEIFETGLPVCFNVNSDTNQKKLLYMANNVTTKYLSFCKKCSLQCSCSLSDADIDFILKKSEFYGKIEKLDTKVGYVSFKFNSQKELAFFFKSKIIYNRVKVKHQSEPSVGSSVIMKLRRADDETRYNAKFIADYVEVKDLPSICYNENLCSYPGKEQVLKCVTAKVKCYKTLKCGVLGFSYNKKYYEVQFTDDVAVYPQDSQNISLPELWPIGKQLFIDAKLNHNSNGILITSVWDCKKGKENTIHDPDLHEDTVYRAIIKDVKNPKGFVATINNCGFNVPVLLPHSIVKGCDKFCKGSSVHVTVLKQLDTENNVLWKAVKIWNKNESHSTSNDTECFPSIRKGTLMKLTNNYGLLQSEDGLIVFESHLTFLYGICLSDIHLTDLFQPGDILNYSLGMNKSKRNVKVWFGSDIAEDFSTIYNDLITYCSLKQVSSNIINLLMMRLSLMRKKYPNIDSDLRSERLAQVATSKIINKDNKQSKNLKRYALLLTSSSSNESLDEIQSCETIVKPINSAVNTSNSLVPFRSQSEKCVKIKNDIQRVNSTPTFSEKMFMDPEVTSNKQFKQNKNYNENNSTKEKYKYWKQERVENNQTGIIQANQVGNKNVQSSHLKPCSKGNFQFLSEELKNLIEVSLISTLSNEGLNHDCLHLTTYELLNTLELGARKHIIKAALKALSTACAPNLQEEIRKNIYDKWKKKFEYEIERKLTIKANENVCQINSHQHDVNLCTNQDAEAKMADKGTQTISTGNILHLKLCPNI